MKTTVYSPDRALRNPGLLFREMFRDLSAARELAWRLMVRNISAQYRQTMFGYLWAFLPPLFAAGTFILLREGNVFQTAETGIPYAAWTLIGTFLWQVFADALRSPMRHVSQARPMLSKINFPREALILAGIGEVCFNFLVRFVIIVVVLLGFKIAPTWHIVLVPVCLLMLISLGITIGVLLTPIGILYQDIERGIPLLLPFLMLLSGVVLPLPREGLGGVLAKFNLVTPLLETSRDWLTGQPADLFFPAMWVSLGTPVFLLFGWLVYRVAMPHLIARMPA